ncbi:MAG: hypothetical protein ABSA59_18095 [Terriglobia bacterium]
MERIVWFGVAPFREVRLGMAHLAPERGEPMRKVNDLKAVFAQLRAEADRGDIEPRQKQLLEQAIETLKRFRRKKNPNSAETYRCVRDVAEKLLEAFLRQPGFTISVENGPKSTQDNYNGLWQGPKDRKSN